VTGSTTTWFGPGGYEESVVGGTRTQRHELGPVIVLRQNGSDSFKAVLRDRLGSQVMLVNGSPGQSTGLHASPNPSLDGRYTVRWNAMPGASRYELRESINNGLPSLIYNGPGLSWSPPSPKPIGTYRYTLRVCSPVCAADSAPVTEEVVPGPPAGLVLNPNPSTNGSFALSWNPVVGAETYQVEEKTSTDVDFHVVQTGIVDPPGAAGPSWQASGKPAGDYQYRVRSCLTLCGNPSAIVTEVVTGGGGGQAPGAPFMNPPGAGSNTGQIALSWTPAAAPSPQPDYYAVQENGGYNIHVPSGTSLSLTRGNGTFTYKVRGCRNNPANPYAPFCGAYSNTVSVTVNASSIPAVPTGVTSSLSGCFDGRNATYTIGWNASPGATRYELTETNDNDATTSTDTNAVSPESFTRSVPTGLDSITYTYKVRACSASGCSQDSAAAQACIGIPQVINSPDSSPQSTAYDAFGKVRNGDYSDRQGGKLNLLPDTVRGFTGHQHVDDVRLIHMNGRVYDYQLGRFLSVDPIIQFPANSQSLNPYSYIMNNPLSGRDPSGYAMTCDDGGENCSLTNVKSVTVFQPKDGSAAFAVATDDQGNQIKAEVISNGSESSSQKVQLNQSTLSGLMSRDASAINAISAVGFGGQATATGSSFDAHAFDIQERNALAKDYLAGYGKSVAVGAVCMEAPSVCMAYTNYSAYSKLAQGDYEGAKIDAALTITGGLGARSVSPMSKPSAGAASIEEVSIAARETLASRVESVHAALDPIAQTRRTTAGLDTTDGTRILAAGGRDLSPAQRATLAHGEAAGRLPGAHAEVTLLRHAAANGLSPAQMAVSRAICPACAAKIEQSGGRLTSQTTAEWP
jgi:RHS repeat-associated protein